MEVEAAVATTDAILASGTDEELFRVNDWSEEVEEEERLEQRAGSITPGKNCSSSSNFTRENHFLKHSFNC